MPRYAGTVALEYAKAKHIRRAALSDGKECQFCEFWNPLPKTPQATALVRFGRCDLSGGVTEQGDGCHMWLDDGMNH